MNKRNNIIKKTAFSLIEVGVVFVMVALIIGAVLVYGKRVIATAKCSGDQISVGSRADTYSNAFNNHTQAAATVGAVVDEDQAFKDCINNEMGLGLVSDSCKTILDTQPASASGVYTLTAGHKVYCDMTTDGGGWTLIVAQYEVDVADETSDGEPGGINTWNEGIQGDYMIDNAGFTAAILDDYTLGTIDAGFTLNTSEIPTHTQIAFGKGSNPTFVGYSNYVYTTSDIDKTAALPNLGTGGGNYHIHRNNNINYANHDPDSGSTFTGNSHRNALTYDATPGAGFSWAFIPHQSNADTSYRGFSIGGIDVRTTIQPYAWTVWVR